MRFHPIHDTNVRYPKNSFDFTKTYSFYVKLKCFDDIIIINAFTELLYGKVIITVLALIALTSFDYTTLHITVTVAFRTMFIF